MNIELIQEGYEVERAIEETKRQYQDNNNTVFKCRGCKKGKMDIMETIEHFRICQERDDNLAYKINDLDT